MKTKKQLNKRVKELELKLHTKKYIHIPRPSLKGIGKFSLMIITAFLSYFNFLLILKIWDKFNLDYVFVPKFIDLIILYPLVGEFILVSLTIILFVSLFKKLKSFKEEGLIRGLIRGLIAGLIVGIIGGLIGVLIAGLIAGLIIGLIVGLIAGLIGVLIAGLIGEFE